MSQQLGMSVNIEIGEDAVLVNGELFVRLESILVLRRCPFCADGGKLLTTHTEGFTPQVGCTRCNRWFNKPTAVKP